MLKTGHSLPRFLLFSSFLQTVNMFSKNCRWPDSNPGPLVLEATALPTETTAHFWASFNSDIWSHSIRPRKELFSDIPRIATVSKLFAKAGRIIILQFK